MSHILRRAFCAAFLLAATPFASASTLFHFRFEGGANGAAMGSQTDVAGGLVADRNGPCVYSTAVAPSSSAGGSCFDASDDFDYFAVNDNVRLRPAGDFTLECFVRASLPYPNTGGATGHNILTKQIFPTGGTITSWGMGFDPPTNIFYGFICAGGDELGNGATQSVVATPARTNDGKWHHLAMSYARGNTAATLSFYFDGVLTQTLQVALTPINYTTYPMYIGAGNYGSPTDFYRRNFAGKIDEVRMSDVALTPADFLYNPCPADFNRDGFLDFSDFDVFVGAFENGDVKSDFNGDGFLDFSDFDAFVLTFEAGC
jgi:hypothetical protein